MTLRIATGHGRPGLFYDEADLIPLLAKRGIEARAEAWQDLDPDGQPVLVRTTWDYTQHRDRFLAWLDAIDAAGGPCWNPTDRMRWNMDKRYLSELQERGHAVVPSRILEHYDEAAFRETAEAEGWPEAIAKPVVGAAAEGLVLLDADGIRTFGLEGNTWAPEASTTPTGPCLVQPFIDEVTRGEWSLFYFAGQYSHAIIKRPKVGDIRVQEEHGGSTVPGHPSPQIRRAADALAAEIEDCLIVRIDGIDTAHGWRLMELELIEPELYFRYAPDALERFAGAVAGALA